MRQLVIAIIVLLAAAGHTNAADRPDILYIVSDDPAARAISAYGSRLAPKNIDRLAKLRERVGDDGSHHPKREAIVQEFWDYDDDDRAKALEISHAYLKRRKQELAEGKRGPRTWVGE